VPVRVSRPNQTWTSVTGAARRIPRERQRRPRRPPRPERDRQPYKKWDGDPDVGANRHVLDFTARPDRSVIQTSSLS
jgi:hypothetical protein